MEEAHDGRTRRCGVRWVGNLTKVSAIPPAVAAMARSSVVISRVVPSAPLVLLHRAAALRPRRLAAVRIAVGGAASSRPALSGPALRSAGSSSVAHSFAQLFSLRFELGDSLLHLVLLRGGQQCEYLLLVRLWIGGLRDELLHLFAHGPPLGCGLAVILRLLLQFAPLLAELLLERPTRLFETVPDGIDLRMLLRREIDRLECLHPEPRFHERPCRGLAILSPLGLPSERGVVTRFVVSDLRAGEEAVILPGRCAGAGEHCDRDA